MIEGRRLKRYEDAPPIGWTKKEMVWLEAALTLCAIDFFLACDDIASMSGRTVAAIVQQAKEIQRRRSPMASPVMPTLTEIRRPTYTERTGGNARRVKTGAP